MHAKLIQASSFAKEIPLVCFPAVLGRSLDVAVCLGDRWVSRRHCEIDRINGTLVVRDLESRHGVFVNGERVRQAILFPGDRLTLGTTSFIVTYERQGAAALVGTDRRPAEVDSSHESRSASPMLGLCPAQPATETLQPFSSKSA